MKNPLSTFFALICLGVVGLHPTCAGPAEPPKLDIPYGHNYSASRTVELNGIKVYFETYGEGTPMLMIHGNGDDIAAMGYQIKFFSEKYQVIAADSRGHGRSEMGAGHLTYEQMAEDANALLEILGLKHVYVLGWSDGGIIGLLLAMNHPDKVAKLAIMGANLNPHGAYDWAYDWAKKQETNAEAMIAKGDKSEPWPIYKQYYDLLANQPNIPFEKLKDVTAPTLVMAGDRDVIRDGHTLEIFHALPKAHLCIFPGATHLILWDDPVLFDQTVDKFFREPFTRPDTREEFLGPSDQPQG
jgi:pimeloyl-ACP methyl ester carboxylesterase